MDRNSRIFNSFRNARVAVVFYFINLLIQFFYRKIFLNHLGSEVLGLNTTAMNLLQFLNIAELGVGAAVSYSLYSPLSKKDHASINEIISVQGYLYTRIGVVVMVAGLILMLFFPMIFSDMSIPMWYAYSTFGVLFLSSLSSYFFSYQQILFISDQKEYQLNYILQGAKFLKIVLQLISINFFSHGYIFWIFWELLSIIVITWGINYKLNKEYSWLDVSYIKGKAALAKHSEITLKTKQLFAHKLAGFALTEVTPLVIFAFTNLSFVAKYGNYLLVIAGVTALLGAIFNSVNASVGNLVSEGNSLKIEAIFEELFTVRFLLAVISCYSIYKLTPIFITLWLGTNYLLDPSVLLLLVILMFINITRLTVDSFLNAYGLFKDIFAPILELILNVSLSISLGKFFGVKGVLAGVILSNILIVLCWKPFFLFRNGIKTNPVKYFQMYFKQVLVSVLVITICEYAISYLSFTSNISLVNFITFGFLVAVTITLLMILSFSLLTKGLPLFITRLKKIIIAKQPA
ncbi:hypothetical protein MUY27_02540 [Mucilaginibacter sp. RS28]|uniref:Sugar transporter n=1 Tax=Mucilaginibacter straminoryzae TaxID=2932774 RepID=A0A9X1WZU5_9SPHI|nr:hypothetical protein [Mucilaginibacter straminoryzae]MCJ8208569.1 hypothetical protein [Mucilaginibacter straminoryzae]